MSPLFRMSSPKCNNQYNTLGTRSNEYTREGKSSNKLTKETGRKRLLWDYTGTYKEQKKQKWSKHKVPSLVMQYRVKGDLYCTERQKRLPTSSRSQYTLCWWRQDENRLGFGFIWCILLQSIIADLRILRASESMLKSLQTMNKSREFKDGVRCYYVPTNVQISCKLYHSVCLQMWTWLLMGGSNVCHFYTDPLSLKMG